MLRTLMEKVDNMQEQTGNVRREMEILRKNQKEYWRSKTWHRNEEYLYKLDMAEKTICELKHDKRNFQN